MGCFPFPNYRFQMGVTVMGFAEHFGLFLAKSNQKIQILIIKTTFSDFMMMARYDFQVFSKDQIFDLFQHGKVLAFNFYP